MQTKLHKKLIAFNKAAQELRDEWDKHLEKDDSSSELIPLYPFDCDFNEIVDEIKIWCDKNTNPGPRFYTVVGNEEKYSLELRDLERQLESWCGKEIGTPTLYSHSDNKYLYDDLDLPFDDWDYLLVYDCRVWIMIVNSL